jgi:SpoIID/LytB domain protein
MIKEPRITVGIMDWQQEVKLCLNGVFYGDGFGSVTGVIASRAMSGMVVLIDDHDKEIVRAPAIKLEAGSNSTFLLFDVTIGNRFHWERKEDQAFHGSLIIKPRKDGSIAVINDIPIEDYLKSVISSEMSGAAPSEFLKAHAIISRSWLIKSLERKENKKGGTSKNRQSADGKGEIIRWYEQEEHDIYDVCADDHCQRYQGITKIISAYAGEAVRKTRGLVITYHDEICDARYSKACGGITEDFETAWDDKKISYLVSVSDSSAQHNRIITEDDAARWIGSEPEAYCNTKDGQLLETILPDFDRETPDFFRWSVEYSREELEEILREKSGFDFGMLKEIIPLRRGPSGRITRLRIVGSKKTVVVGKELEIRRWLSKSHLYSSAFIVEAQRGSLGEVERFVFYGAGWGHGVGLCQIGAAVMAARGFTAEEILKHYFCDVKIKKIY